MGRRLLVLLTACAASGCIDWGSLYQEHDGGFRRRRARPGRLAQPGRL